MLRGVIRAWRYVVGCDGREDVDPEHLREAVDPDHAVVWIDAASPEDESELHTLKAELGLSATVVDAILNPRERTKLMRYGDYFHVAVHDCDCVRTTVDSREIDIVTGPGWLVTVRHPSPDGSQVDLDEVARRFELQRDEHRTTEQGFLLWALFDVIVDRYFEVIDAVDERLDEIEEVVFRDRPPPAIPREIFAVRRDLSTLRRAAAPMREVVNAIIRKEIDFVDEPALVHFHDVYDRVLRVGDLVEAQRDLLTGLLEANLAVTSNQLNQVMKKMTSWGAILIVATLIAGIYGMNFRHMPELHWQYGYAWALGLMGVTTFVLYRMFKRRDWL
jgi:magnesium transporter